MNCEGCYNNYKWIENLIYNRFLFCDFEIFV